MFLSDAIIIQKSPPGQGQLLTCPQCFPFCMGTVVKTVTCPTCFFCKMTLKFLFYSQILFNMFLSDAIIIQKSPPGQGQLLTCPQCFPFCMGTVVKTVT